MPDGKRKRRFSQVTIKRQWYALHRSSRFQRRFGWSQGMPLPELSLRLEGHNTVLVGT